MAQSKVNPLDRKKCLIIKGRNSSEVVNNFLRDVAALLKPHVVKFDRKNDILPFEGDGTVQLESHCTRNDCSLFVFGYSSKKRPHSVVLGRLFEGRILDMVEMQLSADYVPIAANSGLSVYGTPLVVFAGAGWETDSTLHETQDLLLDIFHGLDLEKISLLTEESVATGRTGIERAIVFSAPSPDAGASLDPIRRVHIRSYHVRHSGHLHESERGSDGRPVPVPELRPNGFAADCILKRTVFAEPKSKKMSRNRPRAAMRDNLRVGETVAVAKSIKRDSAGVVTGRLFPEQQSLDDLSLKRFKAFKRSRKTEHKAKN